MSMTTEVMPSAADTSFKAHEQVMEGLRDGAAKATAGFEQGHAKLEEGLADASAQARLAAATSVALGQEAVGACARSFLVWSAGLQALSKEQAAAFQVSLEETTRQMKAVNAAESIKETFEMQAAFIRGSKDRAVVDAGRFAAAYLQVAADAIAPITAAMGRVTERMVRPT